MEIKSSTEHLQERIAWHLENIKKYDEVKDDLDALVLQVAALSDIFKLISEDQKFELLAPVEKALREL